jgi:RES domain-containing protein
VYLAQTPASVLLEVCVHTSANNVPPPFALLKIEGPDLEVPSILIGSLQKNWQTHLEVTRALGTAWLENQRNLLFKVPSAIVPETVNFLFNPSHKQAAKFHIAEVSLIRSICGSNRRRTRLP